MPSLLPDILQLGQAAVQLIFPVTFLQLALPSLHLND